MNIERNEPIRFHEKGTLEAVTRWMATHYDGMAEWLKNVRRQYQIDRANVGSKHRVGVILLKDQSENGPARIGVLDVGGATLEDVTAWSTWDDPDASRRGSRLVEEETQGNGGKSYMYRLFTGPARILGVRDRRRNCKGFEGEPGTVERGTPGWVPSTSAGREVEISSLEGELRQALAPYDTTFDDLPASIRAAIRARQSFTLVEGEQPTGLYKGRIDAQDVIGKVTRHEQSTLCLQQVDFFAIHNGRLLNDGQKLQLPPIAPYPGLEVPVIHDIPEQLPLENGELVSTTEAGKHEKGRLTLHTSAENMPNAYKNLKPRWQITYCTQHQMIGSKSIAELAPATPGANFIYGTVELPALEPAYVEHGRRRPKEGPLTEAIDRFIGEKIRDLARQINDRRKEELDEKSLDEVHEENRKLDEFKNRFLPNLGEGSGGRGKQGLGPEDHPGPGPIEWGTVPEAIEYSVPDEGIHVAKGITMSLRQFLEASVRDALGRPVRCSIDWSTSEAHIATVTRDGRLSAREKGTCEVWARVKGTTIETERMPVQVWNIDHVLLTPRKLEIPLGTREQVLAEVTDDDGARSTGVLLEWRHDADDQMIVRISRTGVVTGNRLGRTSVMAGAGNVWARIPVEVHVIPNPEERKHGSGFPRLLLTGRDEDPASGMIREGDPESPALWQEASDFVNNVWWLNLQSPDAKFAFKQRGSSPELWRTYHGERVVEMVVQVWMGEEFTRKGESQRPDFWAGHLAAMNRLQVRIVQQMWKELEPYIHQGRRWEPDMGGTA